MKLNVVQVLESSQKIYLAIDSLAFQKSRCNVFTRKNSLFLFKDFHRNSSQMQLKLIFSEHEKSGSHRFQKSMTQCFHEKKLKLKVEVKKREVVKHIDSFIIPIWVPKVMMQCFHGREENARHDTSSLA